MKELIFRAASLSLSVKIPAQRPGSALFSKSDWQLLTKTLSSFLSSSGPCTELKIALKIPRQWLVSVEFCHNPKIRRLNRVYRNKDKATDVLSFGQFESLRKPHKVVLPPSVPVMLGDIIISLDLAKKQAKDHAIPLQLEIIHLIYHGFLHLLGFDHEISQLEEKKMNKWEKYFLDQSLHKFSVFKGKSTWKPTR